MGAEEQEVPTAGEQARLELAAGGSSVGTSGPAFGGGGPTLLSTSRCLGTLHGGCLSQFGQLSGV